MRFRIGKFMYLMLMRFSGQAIAQAVRGMARHMTCGDETHMTAMLGCIRYVTCTKDSGLLSKPMRNWDGTRDFKIRITECSEAE